MTDVAKVKYSQPVNIAAERAVLAGLCQYNQDIYVDVKEIVSSSCFTTNNNQIVYSALDSILGSNSNIDTASLMAKISTLGYTPLLEDKVFLEYLGSLFRFNVSKENVKKHSIVIKKLDIARKLQSISKQIYIDLSAVDGDETIDSIISKVERPIFDFTTNLSSNVEDKTVKISDGVDDIVSHLLVTKQDIIGIPSPWPIYNDAIGGGRRRGGVYLTASRPKTGKSSLAINDSVHVAKLGIPVLYLDTEMTRETQIPRILANLTSISIRDIESGRFGEVDFTKNQVLTSTQKLKTLPLWYRKVSGKEFSEILSIIRRWILQEVGVSKGKTNNCLIIYDYFKLMNTNDLKEMQEFQALGYQIQQLTDMCSTYDVPCSAFVQTNRDGISKDSTDIISQSDRLLWLCSSLAILKRKTQEEISISGPLHGNTKLIVTQDQRFGPGLDEGDYINLAFDRERCIIRELGTKNNMQNVGGSGFPTTAQTTDDNTNDVDEFGLSDDDFDKFKSEYRDDTYRNQLQTT